ncbi:MAG TPA: amidoligase family protein [Gemmatimonadales bacterium]|nr:amidoligase family protein [Gemmatimonadales bacterium]
MTAPKININDVTFGIEIETCLPRGLIQVGGYHNGLQIPGLPEGWLAERDGSIRCTRRYEPCEVVSPVLKGADGIKQIIQILDWLRTNNARVNSSTGLHIHVGWNHGEKETCRLVTTVANFEKAIFASTGTRARETGSFCNPIKTSTLHRQRYNEGTLPESARPTSRYHVLNLVPLSREANKRTIEFRAFAGTLNKTKVLGYIRLCLGLVEKALSTTRAPQWEAKQPAETSPIHRAGAGQTELNRLFYFLGWTKGREAHTFGNITCEGAPKVTTCKKELMRLAKKYDAETTN